MSSLHIINRGTKSKPGGGLPWYSKLEYVFSNWNNGFNDINGLWSVPNEKIPTFQLWLPYANLTSFTYKETEGGNQFTGTTFTPPNPFTVTGVQLNGDQRYIWETSDDGNLIVPAPDGRWVAELIVNDGVSDFPYYSEEFVTKDCC